MVDDLQAIIRAQLDERRMGETGVVDGGIAAT